MTRKLTPHQRIVRAAEARRGVRLTADEAFDLAVDEAIRHAAENDDEADAMATETKEGESDAQD